ncbi:hypothetical protein Bca101_052571 [Brassica carinata]
MTRTNITLPLLFTLLTFIDVSTGASTIFNVVSFGAKPDGVTDSTVAFLKAWKAACGSVAAATVMVPSGTFMVKGITFGGPCKSRLKFQVAGTVVAPPNYRAFGNSGYWILFNKVSKMSLIGGTFDARASGFWACRKSGQSCPPGVRSFRDFQTAKCRGTGKDDMKVYTYSLSEVASFPRAAMFASSLLLVEALQGFLSRFFSYTCLPS